MLDSFFDAAAPAHAEAGSCQTVLVALFCLVAGVALYSALIAWLYALRNIKRWREELKVTRNTLQVAHAEATHARQQAEKEAHIVSLLRGIAAAANSSRSADEAVRAVLEMICDFIPWPVGHAYIYDSEENLLRSSGIWCMRDEKRFQTFKDITTAKTFARGEGLPGRAWNEGGPIWSPDISMDKNCPRTVSAGNIGVKGGFAFPVFGDDNIAYVLEFFSVKTLEPNDDLSSIVMIDIGAQLSQVIERVAAQQALEEAKDTAENATAAKSDFLANMSHELRTPLNSILGMTRLLLESRLEGEQRQLADTVLRSSTNLLEIVNDILDLSKIEAGEMKLEHIGVDLNYVLNSVVESVGQIAKEKRLPILRHYEKEIFPYVLGDPARLSRILTNLLGNAIKYTDKGQIEVRAAIRRLDAIRIEFRCEISDTGIGIPPDKLASIFEKFMQADVSTTRKYGGTGLGLAITKQLAELMGGAIGVESTLGLGSAFWIAIPFEITDKLSEEKQIRRKKYMSGILPPERVRVLVAEDHALNQMFISRLLRRFGIGNFEIVEDGSAVLKRYQEAPWDIILMDCHMPGKSGYDTARDIRGSEKHTGRRVPIIAMTANAMVGDKEKCLRAGMDEYISKPIAIEELKEILSQWIHFPNIPLRQQEAPPVDLSGLRIFSEGDMETEKELIRVFIDQSDRNFSILRESYGAADPAAWQEAAHMFKGGAAGVGAALLSTLCNEAQHSNGSAGERRTLFEKISGEYARVKTHLKEIGLLS